MPRRFPPVPAPPTLLSSEHEHAEYRIALRRHAAQVFRYAVWELGEEEARALFKGLATPRRGSPKGSRNSDRDHDLLIRYRELAAQITEPDELGKLPGRVSREFAKGGRTPKTIEKRLRRLLNAQARRERLSAKATTRYVRSLGFSSIDDMPPTLLNLLVSDRDKK